MAEFSTDQIARGLERVSEDIKREVGALIPVAADQMVGTLERRYPVGRTPHPGVPHMRDDIFVRTLLGSDVLLSGRKVTGPHLAYIWQEPTKHPPRQYPNTKSSGMHRTGAMPGFDRGFFERTAAQTRAEMMRQAQTILDRSREIV